MAVKIENQADFTQEGRQTFSHLRSPLPQENTHTHTHTHVHTHRHTHTHKTNHKMLIYMGLK